MKKLVAFIVILILSAHAVMACTSAIVLSRSSVSGRPLLWKHRDTGHESNFVETVPADGANLGYVALFNGGDSILSEAWIGVNEAGFAIMNTASYNLVPDTAVVKDKEGLIMTEALKRCRSLADFEQLLETWPKPLGVQANFGAIDAYGNGAYFETSDCSYVKYDAKETPDGVLIRTNFSVSGGYGEGLGHVRYINACCLLKPYVDQCGVSPVVFTEVLSRSFYHSGNNEDAVRSGLSCVEDLDFIPRHSTSASVVIEGAASEAQVADCVMWTVPGYPPCSHVFKVTIDSVPEVLRPVLPGWISPQWNAVNEMKHSVIYETGGKYYVHLDKLGEIDATERKKSRNVYGR